VTSVSGREARRCRGAGVGTYGPSSWFGTSVPWDRESNPTPESEPTFMKRKTFDAILTAVGAALTVFLVVAGSLGLWAFSFANSNV